MRYPPHVLIADLDRRLGNPHDPTGEFSYARCAALDAREEFPTDVCALLDRLGLAAYYAPAEYGGTLNRYEDLLAIIRLLARRDFTVALAHCKTYLGAATVWMGGTEAQARHLASRVAGGAVVSLALTEQSHGSDLAAGDVTATQTPDGYCLTGEKWLINNATRADVVCVLARTDPAGGARGFSLLQVDKGLLGPQQYRCLPAVRTHGVRGADISGIRFRAARLPADALVGAAGGGLELVLKSLQVTRALVPGMSLGMADQALRLAVGFALRHEMYRRRLFDLPQAHRTLAEAYADLLVAEAVSLVAARAIHTLTGELSLVSSVVKYLVPATIDQTITRLGQVLGARALLTEAYADGMFQKLERDHRIVGIFDGNTLVNLNSVINQFGVLARSYRRGLADEAALAATTTLATPPPAFDRTRLSLIARHGCSVVQSISASVQALWTLAAAGEIPAALAAAGQTLQAITDELHERLRRYRPTARDVPVAAFELAKRYALCFAAAACVRLWLDNRLWRDDRGAAGGQTMQLWADGLWLQAALARLLAALGSGAGLGADAAFDRLGAELARQYRDGALFSLLPCPLAGEPR